MRSIDDLMTEAKWGQLTAEELAYVVQRIQNMPPEKPLSQDERFDLSSLIFILGLAGPVKYSELVAKFLRYPADDWVCISALKALCRYWDLAKEYLDDIKFYIIGAEWDIGEYIRLMALSLAGEYLNAEYDRELVQMLLDVFENLGKVDYIRDTDDYCRYLLQSCAYCSLVEATGGNYLEVDVNEVEKAIQEKDLSRLDLTVIQKAHQMVQDKS